MRSLLRLHLLLRSKRKMASDTHPFQFSKKLCNDLRLRTICHLQLTEACFNETSLSTLLRNTRTTLTTLELRLVTFENLHAFHDVLSTLSVLEKMTSFRLMCLNADRDKRKTSIIFGNSDINMYNDGQQYDWEKKMGTITDSASELERISSLGDPNNHSYYTWEDIDG
jgi:hypothetical protein